MNVERSIKENALAIGFDLIGVAPIEVGEDLNFARQWVEQGRGGEMNYLRNPKRDDPRQVLASARSVVCAGLIYNSPRPYSTEVHAFPRPPAAEDTASTHRISPAVQGVSGDRRTAAVATGWISRYAWGRDYHKVMRGKLEALRTAIQGLAPGVETRVYADTGPLVERAFARFSGVGWMGKNTCLINQEKGSWFFLGVILTNLALRPDLPAPDRCGSCQRCIDACPTGALDQPYVMDASRCIAYLTIELKGSIPRHLRPATGANIFGCDICQDVCPWNARPREPEATLAAAAAQREDAPQRPARGAATTTTEEFQPRRVRLSGRENGRAAEFTLFDPPLAALAAMTEEEFRHNFSDSPIQRAKFQGFIRNLCVAMGNSASGDLVPALRRWALQENAVIREHAEWALAEIERSHPR